MSSFKVPDRDKVTLQAYFALSEVERNGIIKCLANAEINATVEQLSYLIHEKVGIHKELSGEIVRVVFTMMMVLDRQARDESPELTRQKFSEKVEEYLNSSEGEEFRINASEELYKLLDANKDLVVSAKGEELAFNRQKLLTETRIITDIRPIFVDSGSEDVSASIILYSLKMVYIENGNEKEEYFALDKSDLEKLKAQIDRAEKKSASISAKLETSNIKLIEY